MSRNRSVTSLLIFFIFVLVSCDESADPPCMESLKLIEVSPETRSYATSLDTIVVEIFPNFNVERDSLANTGLTAVLIDQLIYPADSYSYDQLVSREFIINAGDSFQVGILNCKVGLPWRICLDVNNLIITGKDSINITPELFNLYYTFESTGGGKGYIGFAETDTSNGCPPGNCVSSNSKGLIVGYTAGVVEDLYINLDKIIWEYDLEGFSELSIFLQGATSAYRLKIETYGDGILGVHEMQVEIDSTFNEKIGIAFSHVPNVYKTNDTKLGIFGTVGRPKIIILENPLN